MQYFPCTFCTLSHGVIAGLLFVCVCVCVCVCACMCGCVHVVLVGCRYVKVALSLTNMISLGMCDVTINQWKLLACFIDVFRYRWAVWFGYKDYNLS